MAHLSSMEFSSQHAPYLIYEQGFFAQLKGDFGLK
jgi:hypothetical protein